MEQSYLQIKSSILNEGSKNILPQEVFYNYSFIDTITFSILIPTNLMIAVLLVFNGSGFYFYSVQGFVLLVPLSALTITFAAIIYSFDNAKTIFYTNRDLIRYTNIDKCISGIVFTLFLNILISVILKGIVINNKVLLLIIYVFNLVLCAICFELNYYACDKICKIAFKDSRSFKIIKSLVYYFDMDNPDLDYARIAGKSLGQIKATMRYVINNYLQAYEKISGDDIGKIDFIDDFSLLNKEERKSTINYNVAKHNMIFGAFVLVATFVLYGQGLSSTNIMIFLCIQLFYAIFVSLILKYKMPKVLLAVYGRKYGYRIVYSNNKIKSRVIGYREPISINKKYDNYITSSKNLVTCYYILYKSFSEELLFKSIDNQWKDRYIEVLRDGVGMICRDDKNNMLIKAIPFEVLGALLKEQGLDIFDDESLLFLKYENEFIKKETEIILKNIL